MSAICPFRPVPGYPPGPLVLVDKKLRREAEKLKKGISLFLQGRVGKGVETVTGTRAIVAVYGGGKTHFVLRLIYELRNADQLSSPEATLLDLKAYNDAKEFLSENGRTPVLAVYLTFERIFEEYGDRLVSYRYIIRSVIEELISPELKENKELEGVSQTLRKELSFLRGKAPKDIIEGLLKRFSRIIIVLDEMEAVLDPFFTRAGREEILRGLIRFFNAHPSCYLIVCIPEEVWPWFRGLTAQIVRMDPPLFLGEFSFDTARHLVDSAYKSVSRPNPFTPSLIYSIWELARHGGRNFLRLCHAACVYSKGKPNYEAVYDNLEVLIKADGNYLIKEFKYFLEEKIGKKFIRILKLLLGEYTSQTIDEILQKTKLQRKVVTEFMDTFINETPELLIKGPLIIKCRPIERISPESSEKWLDENDVGHESSYPYKIWGIGLTLQEVMNKLSFDVSNFNVAYVPENFEDFKAHFPPRADPAILERVHRALLEEVGEEEKIALSHVAFREIVGEPVMLPAVSQLFNIDSDRGIRKMQETYDYLQTLSDSLKTREASLSLSGFLNKWKKVADLG